MKKVAIILSGCGVYDGAEIQEAVLTMLAIERHGASYRCFAPNIEQHHVINHLTGQPNENDSRNVLVESARISRGDAEALTDLYQDEFDALILPGGFGAAKNLCDFALTEGEVTINKEVQSACQQFIAAKKPIGFMCIAPVMIPLVAGDGVKGTIGKDISIADATQKMGLDHVSCAVDDIVVDDEHNIISTPAYMLATSISEAAVGIDKLVAEVVSRS